MLRAYFERHLAIAADHAVGFLLEVLCEFDDATLATLDEEEIATLTSQGEDEDLIGTDQLPLDELLKPAEDAKPKAHLVVKMLALGALVLGVAAAASRRRNDDLHYA